MSSRVLRVLTLARGWPASIPSSRSATSVAPLSTTSASCFALQPYIVDAALNYLAASAAQRMGFVELYRYLRAFVDNDDKVT